ncbi:MmgE/PrpD family protein [Dankookia sp. P2]|uniref:MmgE/PrpD family protein n=1 Tax=Dankookia sp. P2 TaxID=3423955 RepID=UPI003D66737D
MAAGLTERICDLVAQPPALSAADREDILLAFADTLACAHAGWAEPVTRAVAGTCRGGAVPLLDGSMAPGAEQAALVTATAGHALDYDDVHLDSTTHPSVVIVPALLAVQAERGWTRRGWRRPSRQEWR